MINLRNNHEAESNWGLVCTVAQEYAGQGHHEDLSVHADGPIFDVVNIEQAHFVKGDIATAIDLPEACHTGEGL